MFNRKKIKELRETIDILRDEAAAFQRYKKNVTAWVIESENFVFFLKKKLAYEKACKEQLLLDLRSDPWRQC